MLVKNTSGNLLTGAIVVGCIGLTRRRLRTITGPLEIGAAIVEPEISTNLSDLCS